MTSIDWRWEGGGLPTNIPAARLPEDTERTSLLYLCHLVMFSNHDRTGRANIFFRYGGIDQTSRAEAIERLRGLNSDGRSVDVSYDSTTAGIIKITFQLLSRERFCETAIRLVQRMLVLLGIADTDSRAIARFTIQRETFAQIDERWIPYDYFLRLRLGLPDRR